MAKRDFAKDATLTLPGITRPVGRPRSGTAKTAAQRMRAYRARRKVEAAEFPSAVTEIPDDWQISFDSGSLACPVELPENPVFPPRGEPPNCYQPASGEYADCLSYWSEKCLFCPFNARPF